MREARSEMGEGGASVPIEVLAAAAVAAAAAIAAAASVKRTGTSVFLHAAGILALGGVYVLLDACLSAVSLVLLFGTGVLACSARGDGVQGGGTDRAARRRWIGPAAASAAVLGVLLFFSFGPQWAAVRRPQAAGLSSIADAGDALVTGRAAALVLGSLVVATALLGAVRLIAGRRDDGS
jgi:hypothetical protein